MSTENGANIERAAPEPQTRRAFLQRLALGSVAASAASVVAVTALTGEASAAHIAKEHPRSVKVFRLRTRKTVSCHACRVHHRYMVFLTRKIAKHHRAHPGCNCPIGPQWMKRRTYRRVFERTGAVNVGFVDLRKV
jgi:hypothetical protein